MPIASASNPFGWAPSVSPIDLWAASLLGPSAVPQLAPSLVPASSVVDGNGVAQLPLPLPSTSLPSPRHPNDATTSSSMDGLISNHLDTVSSTISNYSSNSSPSGGVL